MVINFFILLNMNKILFEGQFSAINGKLMKGPVSVDENNEYHFVNRNTADDLYFYLKKSHNGWHFTKGPATYITPQEFIDSIGEQIDKFNNR
jgi:hypothetical protein